MRFKKNVPVEHREILSEQLKQYKKEMKLTKEEVREVEKWVASGRSPYDNGDYIYGENGCPLDFISAIRLQDEMHDWLMSLSEEEREKELHELRGDYDTSADNIIIRPDWRDLAVDPDAELPFT